MTISAVAPQLLRGRIPAHSNFKITIPCCKSDTCNVPAENQLALMFWYADPIIWDEFLMCLPYFIDINDRTMQHITHHRAPFGGKAVLFFGDFRKILPVIEVRSRMQIFHSSPKTSALHRQVRTFQLTKNKPLQRLQNDTVTEVDKLSLPDLLLSIGEWRASSDEGTMSQLLLQFHFNQMSVFWVEPSLTASRPITGSMYSAYKFLYSYAEE